MDKRTFDRFGIMFANQPVGSDRKSIEAPSGKIFRIFDGEVTLFGGGKKRLGMRFVKSVVFW